MSASHPPDQTTPPERGSRAQLEQAGASDASLTEVHAQLLREKPEPTEGFSPLPIFILFLFSGLIFYCGIYLGTQSGQFSPMVFDVTLSPAEQKAPKQVVAIDPRQLGERLFNQNCSPCHQQTGQGLPGAFPPLVGSPFVLGNEHRVIRILLNGLTGPVEVEGNTFNGAMPAFGPNGGYRFDAEKIAAVLTYVRSAWGNDAPPVSPDTVKQVMAEVGNRTQPWTVQELEPFE